MVNTFYFYDLETSGFNSRGARIMQFAGQRTDLDLKPLGEPDDYYIKLSDDVLPDPEAALVTGLTPQKVNSEGLREAEFLKIFYEQIVRPGTIFLGFNSVRFDDEFMRHMLYRNFYDPYEWQWKDGSSRWDLLDLARMTRALRPKGIKWPFASDGRPSNSLGLLTSINKLSHENAHNALGDVTATLGFARLIKEKQPKLFDFLLKMRDRHQVEEFTRVNPTFLYTSGKYSAEFEKTTVVAKVADHPTRAGILVYDLRHDPTQFINMSVSELATAWKRRWDEDGPHLPVKSLLFNRCPAVAPLSVLDRPSQKRLQLDLPKINQNYKKLIYAKNWPKQLREAQAQLDKQQQAHLVVDERTVDEQLYDGFFNKADKITMRAFRSAAPDELSGYKDQFIDQRLQAMLPLYKARNYPESLTPAERLAWENYRANKLLNPKNEASLVHFFEKLEIISQSQKLTDAQKFILKDLRIYGESLAPAEI